MRKDYLIAAVVFFLFFHVGILLHELGHYSAAMAFGWNNVRLTYIGTTVKGETISPAARIIFRACGPLVDVVSSVIGVLGLWWCRSHDGNRVMYWVSTVLALSSYRWFKVMIQGPGSDEADVSELLGMGWYVLPAFMFFLACAVWCFVVSTHVRRSTLGALLFGLVFGIAGVALWVGVVGPILLPKPA
jgi:hypothetical protein